MDSRASAANRVASRVSKAGSKAANKVDSKAAVGNRAAVVHIWAAGMALTAATAADTLAALGTDAVTIPDMTWADIPCRKVRSALLLR